MTKYKEGDLVTFRLESDEAYYLNDMNTIKVGFPVKGVIKHEAAPKPIVGYVYLNRNGFFYGCIEEDSVEHKIKLTYCPITKAVKAEVV